MAAADASDARSMSIELVYFDIHARGESVRMLFAAANRLNELKDTRVPLFMESQANEQEWIEVWAPKTPFRGLPYLNVTETIDGESFTYQVGHTCPTYVARYLGLTGKDEHDAGVCDTIATEAQSLLGPDLTRTGLTGNHARMKQLIMPQSHYGDTLTNLDKYIANLRKTRDARLAKLGVTRDESEPDFLLDRRLTLADIAIFNCLDEFINGPRGNLPMRGVEDIMRKLYPNLMITFDVVRKEMSEHLRERQSRFSTLKK